MDGGAFGFLHFELAAVNMGIAGVRGIDVTAAQRINLLYSDPALEVACRVDGDAVVGRPPFLPFYSKSRPPLRRVSAWKYPRENQLRLRKAALDLERKQGFADLAVHRRGVSDEAQLGELLRQG